LATIPGGVIELCTDADVQTPRNRQQPDKSRTAAAILNVMSFIIVVDPSESGNSIQQARFFEPGQLTVRM
jgi:hypothetical protein